MLLFEHFRLLRNCGNSIRIFLSLPISATASLAGKMKILKHYHAD